VARLSTVLATAFAAVSSEGDRASDGVSAACAERTGVATIAAAIASAYTTADGASRNTQIAAAPMRTTRKRFVMSRTRSLR